MDYLTERAVFTCNQGGKIKFKDDSNSNVIFNGNAILTTAATVKSKFGICNILLNLHDPNPECKCQLTNWNMPDFLKTSNNNNLLNDSSTNFCPIGGVISVSTSGVNAKLTTGFSPTPISIAAAKIVEIKTDKQAVDVSNVKSSENINIDESKKSNSTVIKESSKDELQNQKNVTITSNRKIKKCLNHNCSEVDTCEYCMSGELKSHELPPIKSNPDDLRKNYFEYIERLVNLDDIRVKYNLKNRAEDVEFYRQLVESLGTKGTRADKIYLKSLVKKYEIYDKTKKIAWSDAAHHIIPGNQVFPEFPKIAYIANLGNFDDNDKDRRIFNINDSTNCIMLLTDNRSVKYDTIFDTIQKHFNKFYIRISNYIFSDENLTDKQRYELMKSIEAQLEFKMQWHDTQHVYTFDKLERANLNEMIQRKFGGKGLPPDYKTAICNELENIESDIDVKNACPKIVRKRIINVIEKVKNHSTRFADSPCKSYPFFVTKRNVYYALFEG